MLPRARAAAERAVALDPTLPEAHLALAHVHAESFAWADAERELRQATSLGPNNAEIAFRVGFTHLTAGRARDAIPAFDRASGLDPFYGMAAAYAGWAKALTGRNEEAVVDVRRALEIDPENEAIGTIFSEVLVSTGHREEAVAFVRQRLARPLTVRRQGFYGLVLAKGGAVDDARALIRVIEAGPDVPGRISALSRLYLAVGDTTRALAALEQVASGDGDLVLSQIFSSSNLDKIRGSQRFAAVLRRFNLDVERLTAPDGGRSR